MILSVRTNSGVACVMRHCVSIRPKPLSPISVFAELSNAVIPELRGFHFDYLPGPYLSRPWTWNRDRPPWWKIPPPPQYIQPPVRQKLVLGYNDKGIIPIYFINPRWLAVYKEPFYAPLLVLIFIISLLCTQLNLHPPRCRLLCMSRH